MKLPIAIATLFLATSTALPAFAAVQSSIPLNDAALVPVETVQYRQTQPARDTSHDVIPGWPCIRRGGDTSGTSAFPSWEVGPYCR